MKIISVALDNVKSYDKEAPAISFQKGVNAIIGENGSGKSTICEAIGFALFDYLHPYSQADFVREGEKSGKVMVTFESDVDKKQYRVERGVNQSRYEVIALETNSKLDLNGKEDVISWLKEQLGVPEMMNIQTLWKSSLGVPQGKFTHDFAETPSIRAELFNPLLEVDIYRNLWRDMKGVIDVLYQQQHHIIEQITRLNTSVEGLPELKKESKTLHKQIKQTKQLLFQINKKITDNQQTKQHYDEIKESIQKLSQTLKIHQEKQKTLKTQLNQAEEELKEITTAETMVNKHKTRYQQYQKYSTQLENLYQKNKEKKGFERKKSDLEKTEATLNQQMVQYEKDVTIAKESKKRLEQLKSQVEQQQQLEDKLDEIRQHEQNLQEINQQQDQITQKISSLRKKYQEIQKQIDSIQQLKHIAEKLPQLQKQKENLLQKQSILTHQQQKQQNAIMLLSQYDQPKCPTCSQRLKEDQKKKIIDQKNKEIVQWKQRKKDVDKKIKALSKQLEKATKAQQELKRLRDLEHLSTAMQDEATEQKQKKKTLDEQKENLTETIKQKQSIKDTLSNLKDPKSDYQQAKIRYEDHKGKEPKVKSVEQQLKQIKQQKRLLLEKIKEYHHLEQKIEHIQTKQKQCKQSYETVLRYKNTAKKKTLKEKQVSMFTEKVITLNKTIEQKKEQLEEQQNKFDNKLYQKLEQTLEQQKQQQITQQTQINEWEKQQNNLDKQIQEKNKEKEQLNQTKKAHQNLKKDIEFTQFLRETYNQTRPLITEILVEEISREADRMYRQLRGVPSEELRWTKDYEIIITEQDNNRAFHKLSGGEQMCAALSVRLAILKLLSNMDIVFLDEPTMNLDEHKKDNLVGQLRELSGFSQIFVISHDETFESMTEHIITLEKRKGATRLLQHFQGGF